jgi:hypothetical protein
MTCGIKKKGKNMTTDFEEKLREDRAPLQYKLFKGLTGKFGALRLGFKRPWTNKNNSNKQEGILFLEMAPPLGNNIYDWENNKLVFSLAINDVGKLVHYFKSPKKYFSDKYDSCQIQLLHDKNAGTKDKGKEFKTLSISKSTNMNNFMVSLRYVNKDLNINKEAKITLAPDEAIILDELLKASIPASLAWTAIGLEE